MTRKQKLINLHSSATTTMPQELDYGEIAVQHTTGNGTQRLWIRTGGTDTAATGVEFVPKQYVDNAVAGAQKTVVTGGTNISVTTASSDNTTTYTVAADGLATQSELDALSGSVVNFHGALSSITNVVEGGIVDKMITGGTGDGAITVSVTGESGTEKGPNALSITHKAGTTASGFNKLSTDAFGHVTASTAVADSDIKGLGFYTTAETNTQITNAINGLDSSAAVTAGNYITGIAIANGKISGITQTALPAETLNSVKVVGTALTITDKAVNIPSASTTAFGVVKISGGTSFITNANGVIKVATGTTNSTVARGDHNHDGVYVKTGDAITSVTMNGSAVEKTNGAINLGTVITSETQLTSASTGTGNVVTAIGVDGHEITAIKGMTAVTTVTTAGTGNAFTTATQNGATVTLTKGSVATSTQGGYADSALQTVGAGSYISVGTKTGNNGAKTQTVTATQKGIEESTAAGQGLADAYDVKTYVEGLISASVEYKGATGATPGTANNGDLYIASAAWTIGTKNIEEGDFIIYNGTSWDVIQKNLDGAVTGTLAANRLVLGNGAHTASALTAGSAGQVLQSNGASAPSWVSKVKSASTADSAAALTGNITTGQVTDLETKIVSTKVNSATTATNATKLGGANAADYAKSVKVENLSGVTGTYTASNNVVTIDYQNMIIDCGTY